MLKNFLEDGNYFIKDEVVINRKQDEFNHEDIAKNLKNIIDKNKVPFSIAITGEWGLGKSSVLELLKDICKNSQNSDNYRFCDINAWKYEKEAIRKSLLKNIYLELDGKKTSKWDELIDAIRNTTQNESEKHLPVLEKISQIFKSSFKIFAQIMCYFLGIYILIQLFWNDIEQFNIKDNFWVRILFPIIASIIISMIQLFSNIFKNKTFVRVVPPIESTDEYEELFSKRQKELINGNKNLKIIVIVDDLDRLCPQKMVEALDAIKAFEGCIFIVPFDEQILKNALEDKKVSLSNSEYLTITGELFFEKMFQFKIPLNPIIEIDIRKYAKDIIKMQTSDLYRLIREENLDDVLDILIHTGVSNPRKLKKIINMFANNLLLVKRRELTERLNEGLLSDNDGIRLVAKLSVLQADFSEFYKILSHRYDFIDIFLAAVNKVDDFNSKKDNEKKFCDEELKSTELAQFFVFRYDYKNELISINVKREYMHLYHFLNATNDISLDKINSFIFMAQSSDAYAVGDKLTREIIDSITSNSIIPIRNAFISDQENINTIESLILNSLSSNRVKYKIVNTIYCLINSITEYNSIFYLNGVGEQVRKLLAVKKLNSIRFDLECLFVALKKANSDGYSLLLEDILIHLLNDDTKYMSHDGKEMDNVKIETYILSLYEHLIILHSQISEAIREHVTHFSTKILQGKNNYVTSKQFLDKLILENGGMNCEFIEKNVLITVLTKTIIDVKNNSETYWDVLKDLLRYYFEMNGPEVSESLYNLVNGKIIDNNILEEILKYANCITENHSNYIIECFESQEIYKNDSYANEIVELISVLNWSDYATEFVDSMLTYIHKELTIDVRKGVLKASDNNCINEMTSFNKMFFENLITLKQYFNILNKLFISFNIAHKTTFFNIFNKYIKSVQNISEEISISVQQICNSLIGVEESRETIIDTLEVTLDSWQTYHSSSSYKEWVNMNIHIFEICSNYVNIEFIEKFIACAISFTSLSEEIADSIVKSFSNIISKANDSSKIKMASFIITNFDYIKNISDSIKVIRNMIEDDTLEDKFDINSDKFIQFIESMANDNLFESVRLVVDYNIIIPMSTMGLFIDKILLDSNYSNQNKKLLSLLFKRECSNSQVGVDLIENILKRKNETKLDSFVLDVFNIPDMQDYELFKEILYSNKTRTNLQVYNILNLAKAFEGFFTKKVKGDLICKMISYTDDSYKVILSRIEKLYEPILKHRDLKKIIGNELALLVKRIGDDELNKEVVIDFSKRNGLLSVLKSASKEYGIAI